MKGLTLLPSATEIVCWLGKQDTLLGISHECDYPETLAGLPRLTASRLGSARTSSAIHQSITALLESTMGVYKLDVEQFVELKPDFVVTQDLCSVCAVSLQQVEEACRTVTGKDVQIISLRPKKWDDIWNDIKRVAKLLGAEEKCTALLNDVSSRVEVIKQRVKNASVPPKTVLTIEWFAPVMISGLWVPEMIDFAGGVPLFATSGEKSRTVSFEQLSTVNPDVVIVKPCGYKTEQTLSEFETLKTLAPWGQWNAGRNDEVYLVDGNSYFNRPGPRLIDSLEILSACIHPGLFPEFETRYPVLKTGRDTPSLL
ncbi:MAG: hypothetical protein COV66_02440 [Nitrospinae bacterium CG11_big_fil_rev_8_21_14_0_20_45_15]|nr:MAG: hypothetical protein COV66_02440 [Nitrospinae bacterium CG11_big_fil_rev_8_21_14_0_20_45_15]